MFNFSTGRRGVASLHTVFTLRPRHDFLQWAFQTLRTFIDLYSRPRDEVELDFKLLPGTAVPDYVWAIVGKDELLTIKQDRWDLVRYNSPPPSHVLTLVLQTFTKTTDNVKPALPPSLCVMSGKYPRCHNSSMIS
jgi:hypothetical protein